MILSNILIITDHTDLAKTWVPGLSQMGAKVSLVACSKLPDLQDDRLQQYHMILIDTYTADFDFVALSRTIRESFEKVLLLLTYDRDERLHLLLYQSGVSEVIVKPVSVPLFLAKITVWLQRNEDQGALTPGHQLHSFPFKLDTVRRTLTIAGRGTLHLTSLESSLLALLMRNEGQVLETDMLIDRVWSSNLMGDENLLKNLIYRLRHKIEPDPATPRYIHTMKGRGYLFQVEENGVYSDGEIVDGELADVV